VVVVVVVVAVGVVVVVVMVVVVAVLAAVMAVVFSRKGSTPNKSRQLHTHTVSRNLYAALCSSVGRISFKTCRRVQSDLIQNTTFTAVMARCSSLTK
jgi:hypothetical protein